MEQYSVTGMSCAACSARVEKAVSQIKGVSNCSVSLLTNSLAVEGTATSEEIISAVEKAGYGASLMGDSGKKTNGSSQSTFAEKEEMLRDTTTPLLKKRLIASVGFLAVLMYFSMGAMMWGWRVPQFFAHNHLATGILQMTLAAIVMVINQKFFTSGFKALLNRAPNMDTLVALGSSVSFGYSLYALFMMSDAVTKGNHEAAMYYMDNFYFEGAAMIVTLITVGKMLESISKGRTTNALKGLMKLAPKTATLEIDGAEKNVPIESVKTGDIFVVRPGENIPVDGVVIEGSTAVNESALTGESIPVDKSAGSNVSAATINQSGFIKCRATRVGEDTTLSQIIKMVSDAAATKAPIAKIADKVSGIFVPAVISIAVITIAIWLAVGAEIGFALSRGIAVLVISCPCALGLATPVAIMVGNGVGAKNGILFKTAASLEETGRMKIVALDKTGTITKGQPQVTDIITAEGTEQNELLQTAFNLESKSEHPLAKAIIKKAAEMNLSTKDVFDFIALPGNGLTAKENGVEIAGGNFNFIKTKIYGELTNPTGDFANTTDGFANSDIAPANSIEAFSKLADELAEKGKTPLFFSKDKKLCGIIAVADVIKEDSHSAIRSLQNMGLHVVMLTGDNERTAKAIGVEAGVDEVIAGVLPDGKENVIRELQKKGKVAMVGDGINDAPALTRADIGIAIGAGTDVAIDAADVVLMNSSLADVPAAIRLSRATLRNIHENLFWAFFYNVILIPVAAGAYYHAFGLALNPMLGAAAMSLSSFCVVMNALRLNLFKVHKEKKFAGSCMTKDTALTSKENIIFAKKQEETKMQKTVKIEGMMCPHCEMTMKKAFEAVDGITSAVTSHEKKCAVLECTRDFSDEELAKIVESAGYKLVE